MLNFGGHRLIYNKNNLRIIANYAVKQTKVSCFCGNKLFSLICIVYSLRAFRLTELPAGSFTASPRRFLFILSSLRAQTENRLMGETGISPRQPQRRVKSLNKTAFPACHSLHLCRSTSSNRVCPGVANSGCCTPKMCLC